MIYAYDENIQMPVKDLYDSKIMLAAVNAAKDMYEKGLKLMDDFVKNYGDFYSPISKDMDWYQQNVTGKAAKALDWMYENGVDPARSAEGRAMFARIANSMPIGEINKRKLAAAAAKEYIKNRGELEAKGLFNSDFERYILGGRSLEDWDTEIDGAWTRTSPGEFKDLNQATSHWFDNLKGEDLGLDPTGMYRIFGVDESQLNRSIVSQMPGFVSTQLGAFYYDKARQSLINEGYAKPTQEQVLGRLSNQIVTANRERMFNEKKADEYAKSDYEHKQQVELENLRSTNNIREHAANKETDLLYNILEGGGDTNGDGKISKDERNAYLRNPANPSYKTIFDQLDAEGKGSLVSYLQEGTVEELIAPTHHGVSWNKKDLLYTMGRDVAEKVIYSNKSVTEKPLFIKKEGKYKYYSEYKPSRVLKFIDENFSKDDQVVFIPTGNATGRKNKNWKTRDNMRYWVAGNLYKIEPNENGKDTYKLIVDDNGNSTFQLEVKDNKNRYARTKQAGAKTLSD